MAFTDVITGKCYIEEITGGHLSYIDDDPLLVALTKFLQASGKLISYERDEELLEKRKREGSDEEESLIWTGPK